MKKVVIQRPGGYGALRIEEHPQQSPVEGQVAVAVEAIGVNFADGVVRMGLYPSAKEFVGWPITPGFEFAGRVRAIGDAVTDFAVGDEVFGVIRFGAYASDVIVDAAQLFPRPEGLTMAQAAAFSVVNLTAYYALQVLAHAEAGERVLVHSAAGGVGSAAIEIARILGCEVIGVVGAPHKVAVAEALGADAIDKSRSSLWEEVERRAPDGVDVILEPNGVATLKDSYRHLARGGRLVVYGFHTMLDAGRGTPNWPKLAWARLRTPRFDPMALVNENRSLLGFNLSYMFDRMPTLRASMEVLLAWVAEGRLSPPAVREFAFDDVAQAQRALESGGTTGKLVLALPPS